MKNKAKLLYRVGVRASKKAARGDLKYKNKNLHKTTYTAVRYLLRFGPRSFAGKVKRELIAFDRRSDTNVYFPNGLVSGTDIARTKHWYDRHGKHVVIVIPSYNDYDLVDQCLQSIKKTVPQKRYTAVVVDDYCTDQSRSRLGDFKTENVEIIFREKNGGFAKAVNTGLRWAIKNHKKSDVVLVNSDTVAHSGWLAALQHGAYEFDSKVGIVGPKLLYPDGRIQSGGSFRNTELPEWFDHYYRFQPADYGPANVPQYCIGVTGACMYIKSSTLNKVGILDEKFQFAFEDMDYCIRAWNKGIRSLYYPAATLTHIESATRAKNKKITPKEKASVKYFWKKWGDWFDNRKVTDEKGRLRIIYVLQTTGVSGGIRVVFEHLNRLQERGYAVELWALDKRPTWMELNVPVRTFKNYQSMIRSLEKEKAIKVATWWETALPVWLSSVVNGIPAFVVQEIESSFYPDRPDIQKSVVSCYRKEFNNITSAEYTLEEIRSLGLSAELIPCGYDDKVFKPLNKVKREKNTLLALGRSFFQKNFKQTLSAWKLLGAKGPKLLLFGSEPGIAGKGPRIEYVKRPTDQGANELYNRATVFAQTSYHEGFLLAYNRGDGSRVPGSLHRFSW